jgi:hypothetical protein
MVTLLQCHCGIAAPQPAPHFYVIASKAKQRSLAAFLRSRCRNLLLGRSKQSTPPPHFYVIASISTAPALFFPWETVIAKERSD